MVPKKSTGLIIFTKVPKSGFVKIRIKNPALPPNFSSDLQTVMLLDTILALQFLPKNVVPVITFHPEQAGAILERIIIQPLRKIDPQFVSTLKFTSQKGKTFTDRFKNAFKYIFHDLKLSSALIIGSDTPHIQPSLLQAAVQILQSNSNNSVIGPSQNEGFYLLGHNKPFNENMGQIFHQNSAYGELGNAMDLLLNCTSVHILPEVTDVDEFKDLKTIRSFSRLLSLNYEKGKKVHFPKHTLNFLKTLDTKIWDSV